MIRVGRGDFFRLGATVGAAVVAEGAEGADVITATVGLSTGAEAGLPVGMADVISATGLAVGVPIGTVVGVPDGNVVGVAEGAVVTTAVGAGVGGLTGIATGTAAIGAPVGNVVGVAEGAAVTTAIGAGVGGLTGLAIGTAAKGAPVGEEVDPDGAEIGADVGSWNPLTAPAARYVSRILP